jgi:hypothetical protein
MKWGEGVALKEQILKSAKELFLKEYGSNLYHIKHFSEYKKEGKNQDYQQFFNEFLFGFRIARNVKSGQATDLLIFTFDWINESKGASDVDGFAEKLRTEGITQTNKTMTSLASKILFLNSPDEVSPYDTLARVALGLGNSKVTYKDFQTKFSAFREYCELQSDFRECFASLDDFALAVEKEFKISKSEKVRKNRFVDLLLWTAGNDNRKENLK